MLPIQQLNQEFNLKCARSIPKSRDFPQEEYGITEKTGWEQLVNSLPQFVIWIWHFVTIRSSNRMATCAQKGAMLTADC
jgi:hypothetical protein